MSEHGQWWVVDLNGNVLTIACKSKIDAIRYARTLNIECNIFRIRLAYNTGETWPENVVFPHA